MRRLLLLALVSVWMATPVRAEVTLVQDGQARAAIQVAAAVMAPDAKDAATLKGRAREAELQRQRLRESVKDLALYLEKIGGARIEVLTQPPQPNDKRVPLLIGERGVETFGPPQKKAPYQQGFRLVVSPRGVGLLGESDLATSYAIYELLDRLGCRWYMPSDMGDVFPQQKTITLADTDFSSAPGTIYRSIIYTDEAYRRRNRYGGLPLHTGHALELIYLTKEDRQKHPEWAAEIGGKTHPLRFRWSNPELANFIGDKILAMHAQDPQPSYSLSPEDGIDFDESKQDRALDANDFDQTFQTTSLTDRLLVLANRIATRVTAKQPEPLFGLLAYAQYTRPPLREKVHPNIVPQIAPIAQCRFHPMTNDSVPGAKDLRYMIEGWGKAARHTSLYFYAYNLAETSTPVPMITKWSVDIPIIYQNNCQFWQPETMPNFDTHLHALYLGGKMAWDTRLKPAEIIADINTRFYGSAALPMTAYWSFMDDVWVKTPEYAGCGFSYLPRWTPERLQTARKLMNEAKAACRTPMETRRVQLADDSLQQFELFMKLQRDLAEGRFATLAGDAERWRKQVLALGEKYKDQHSFTKVPWTPHTVSGLYFSQFYQLAYDDATRVARDFQVLTPPLRQFRYQADKDKKGEALGWHKTDFDDKSWKTTDVCLETWSKLGYHDYFKSMWYRTEVKVPAVPSGKKVHLWVGSTDGSVKVFINGKPISYVNPKGESAEVFNGYCQPASFDITAALKPGEANQIALLCTRTFFNELGTGGLLAPVVLYREKP